MRHGMIPTEKKREEKGRRKKQMREDVEMHVADHAINSSNNYGHKERAHVVAGGRMDKERETNAYFGYVLGLREN